MRTAGIIAEYNPFHNGHAYHIEQTKKLTGCDRLIVVMSGAFTQRGEPALLDKWTRAKMAMEAGADLVLELPALFAMRPADRFALGGVGLLGSLGLVDMLSFGCEIADVSLLKIMAQTLDEEPPELSRRIHAHLSAGKSFPRARGDALSEVLDVPVEWINSPNTVLALEYIQANNRLPRPMSLCVVRRTNDYHSLEMGEVASASAIRDAVRKGNMDAAYAAMPEKAAQLMQQVGVDGFADPAALDNLLLYRLRGLETEQIARLPDVSEGLEMRIKSKSNQAASRTQLLSMLKCKRYTMARLTRICSYALLGLDRSLVDQYPGPSYARILGFKDSARPLLRDIAATSSVELVSSPMQLEKDKCFMLERRATDLWSLCVKDPALRRAGRDFTQKMLVDYDQLKLD
ncbi:nucleotidyltransferase [Eubacteriales bacterium OttesenSCG-928-N13]|nr:nucleotidyltransferase [Eubacteriales bacterium OttesenSCG-928-N13]